MAMVSICFEVALKILRELSYFSINKIVLNSIIFNEIIKKIN